MWKEILKNAGVNIHIIATGGGAGLQRRLWEVPGSSAYLSGCSFPYATEEQEELLGFKPEHFCSEEAAVDLASAAYMKAYNFGGKKPVGVGITASVASEKEHRGEHRVFICVMTDEKVQLLHHTFTKGVGQAKRFEDGERCDTLGFWMLLETANIFGSTSVAKDARDATDLARSRFFARPFFGANGKRLGKMPTNRHLALMPGAYNPPHEGHFGTAQYVMDEYGRTVVYEVTAEPPHKEALSVQLLLQRAKLLHGHDRLFTQRTPLYLDKARANPGIPLVLGADAMVRMLDPKWGVDLNELFIGFESLNTKLLVSGRMIGDKFVTCNDILKDLFRTNVPLWNSAQSVMLPVGGRFDISSTELRNKLV
jgi:nicotinic acid mononucleotide adenylyltransferase/nicotinamide mononucleotide (NMN) deamidase PncC